MSKEENIPEPKAEELKEHSAVKQDEAVRRQNSNFAEERKVPGKGDQDTAA